MTVRPCWLTETAASSEDASSVRVVEATRVKIEIYQKKKKGRGEPKSTLVADKTRGLNKTNKAQVAFFERTKIAFAARHPIGGEIK